MYLVKLQVEEMGGGGERGIKTVTCLFVKTNAANLNTLTFDGWMPT